MANKKISEGVGKKIVEALKKQSEIEINSKPEDEIQEDEVLDFSALEDDTPITDTVSEVSSDEIHIQEQEIPSFNSQAQEGSSFMKVEEPSRSVPETPVFNANQQAYSSPAASSFSNYQQPAQQNVESFVNELDNFEIPNNIAVLKKLITQLPKGVTRYTGAQIIRQTMEALGISMKSVLQEAQDVQDGLSTSSKECQATIQDYKKQIIALEKQTQNYQRQYAALNELISLFIQTGR